MNMGTLFYNNRRKKMGKLKGDCNASSISPIWRSWLHKTTNIIPSSIEEVKLIKKKI